MKYKAFFSYSRQDDQSANWLHRQLDRFRLDRSISPKDKSETLPRTLHPVFRDRTDLPGGGKLKDGIQKALEDSERLVVLCSPASAKSPWVDMEVAAFITMGRGDQIYPVIAPDLPDTDDVERDYFPPSLRGRGLLAADLREIREENGRLIGDGRESGKLKLIAGMLGLELDKLIQRERRRQRQLMALMTGAAFGFAGLAALAGVFAWLASVREKQAVSALAQQFAQRSWELQDNGFPELSLKYALAGETIAPGLEPQFRTALARTLMLAGDREVISGVFDWAIFDVAYAAGDSRLVVLSDTFISVFDTADNRLVGKVSTSGDLMLSRSFSPDGSKLAFPGEDQTIRILDLSTGEVLEDQSVSDRSGLQDMDAGFSAPTVVWDHLGGSLPDYGTWSGCGSVGFRLTDTGGEMFDNRTGETLWTIASESEPEFGFTGDCSALVTTDVSREAITQAFDSFTGEALAELPFEADYTQIDLHSIERSPDGRFFAYLEFESPTVLLLDTETGELRKLDGGVQASFAHVFTPDSNRLAVSGWDSLVRVYDTSSGVLRGVMNSHDNAIYALAVSSDGKEIASGSGDQSIVRWSGEWEKSSISRLSPYGRDLSADITLASDTSMSDFCFGEDVVSPDGRFTVSCTQGELPVRTFDRWSGLSYDAETKNRFVVTGPDGAEAFHAEVHSGRLQGVAFSPDGALMVTIGEGEAIVWDTAGWTVKSEMRRDNHRFGQVHFAADGRVLVTTSGPKDQMTTAETNLQIWEPISGRLITEFEAAGWQQSYRSLVLSEAGDIIYVEPTGYNEGDTFAHDLHYFTPGFDELKAHVCGSVLTDTLKVFSDREVASDPLLTNVWSRYGTETGSVCE